MPRTFSEILKDQPATGDVHIRGGGGRRKPRGARTFGRIIEAQRMNANADRKLGKGEARIKVAKIDDDERLVFGWASVVTKDGKLIIDKQGDVIEPGELERAAYSYVQEERNHGHMHETIYGADLVESMMFTAEKQKALGLDLGQEGWWVGFEVRDDAVWSDIKAGKLPEFSIGGLAVPVDHAE